MRNDLTSNFLIAINDDATEPIQLMVMHFLDQEIGDVYLSDRDIIVDGVYYEGLVEDWGDLSTVSAENAVSATMEMSVTLWNGGNDPFSNKFTLEDPINVFVNIYQTFEGLDPEDMAHLGEFVIQDPLEYSEASQLLKIDLVTTNMRYYGQVGELLTTERSDFKYALPADINKPINLILGNAGEVQCLCSKKPPTATLSGSFLRLPTTITVHEDLEELKFPSLTGVIQIDEEQMRYYNNDTTPSNQLVITQRGVNATTPVDHSDGAEIVLAIAVEYIVGRGPVDDITDVKVNGQLRTSGFSIEKGEETINDGVNFVPNQPAKIIFGYQPTYVEYSKGARTLNEDFDTANDDDTSFHPEWAWDSDNKSLGAILSSGTYDRLSVSQTTVAVDEGEIVKLFLAIEHWPDKMYRSDRVDVYVEGIGGIHGSDKIGYLSRPNEEGVFNIEGVVDISHNHLHKEGGDHIHDYTDPIVSVDEPRDEYGNLIGHEHDVISKGPTYVEPTYSYTLPYNIITYDRGRTITFDFYSHPNTLSQTLTFKGLNQGVKAQGETILLKIYGVDNIEWDHNNYGLSATVEIPTAITRVQLIVGKSSVANAGVLVQIMTLSSTVKGEIINNVAGVTQTDVAGDSNKIGIWQDDGKDGDGSIKNANDIIKYEDNPNIEVDLRENAGRAITQRFDLTDWLEDVSWEWIKDRKVWLQYENESGSEDPNIVITYINFEIEYRQRQVRSTDNITCNVVGLIENRPDAVIQYLLNERAGLPESKFSSVYRDVLALDDSYVTDDTDWMIDGGEVIGVPSGAWFEEAGAWFAANNYKLDGVLDSSLTVKDAIAKITWQTRSRLLWQNGTCQLVIRRETEEWDIARHIDTNDIQLKSISAKRSRVDQIINRINIFHTINRLSEASGSGQYLGTAYTEDLDSIAKHGERVDDSLWLFDLVRANDAITTSAGLILVSDMANDIAEYYKWYFGETRTFYTFNAYLNNFDLQKSDYISLSSYRFDKLQNTPLEINDIKRIFGSGKNKSITILNIIAEAIRIKRLQGSAIDTISITDAIVAVIGEYAYVEEVVRIIDSLEIFVESVVEESVSISDDLFILFGGPVNLASAIAIVDEIVVNAESALEETLSVTEHLLVTHLKGFGSDEFGEAEFGSPLEASPFITTWAIEESDKTITLPLKGGFEYDMVVDWGDGSTSSITAYDDADIAHTYDTAGRKTISIQGLCQAWYFNNGGDCLKFRTVQVWGDSGFIDNGLTFAFYGCSNATSFGSEMPYYSITNLASTWYGCSSATSFPDISKLTLVNNLAATWRDCTSATSLPDVDALVKATTYLTTWYNCSSLETVPAILASSTFLTTSRLSFANIGSGMLGTVEELWDPVKFPNITDYADAFTDATGLTNYAAIPDSWKGL